MGILHSIMNAIRSLASGVIGAIRALIPGM